ncbi:MAG: tyrosine decarboxylase MfnA [Halanaeroarchaeum sp.]
MSRRSTPDLPEPQSFDRVLSSMCTLPHPAARAAAERFLATNPGDPGTYPAVSSLERRTVSMLGAIVGVNEPHGYVGTGGTEANIQAVRAARNLVATDRPNVVLPDSAHFSFEKAADVLDVDVRTVPTDSDMRAIPDAMAAESNEDTVLVVGVAGSTEYGAVDPIPALAEVARAADALFHVDAAFGGFVLPFTDFDWNFDHAPIDSMTVDPHKMGQAAIPAGGFVVSDRSILESLTVETPYLERDPQVTLTGTRSGAGVASAYAAIDAQWPEGYRRNYERGMELATWLAAEFRALGFESADPELPIVTADVPDRQFERLREGGWRISRTGRGELRIVCMPHVRREMLEEFIDDLA